MNAAREIVVAPRGRRNRVEATKAPERRVDQVLRG
jgi:hypothetical protein